MTLGSLFDGIGGWLLAARHAGVTPVWASEIEPFPCSVTARHFPEVKQLGDITKINPDEIEPVDTICAGSPCQDLSIAGKRKGLDGERSGLFRTAVDIVRRMRERTSGKYPRYFVWENVPGAFSSNKGADFRAVLAEIGQTEIPIPDGGRWANAGLAELPKCDIAWRVLDAQYWGVPQRRRRIFLVADFAAYDRRAGEILFEREGVSGNPQEGEEAGEGTARGTADCARTSSALGIAVYDMTNADEVMREVKGGKVQTLNARMGTGGNQVPVIHAYASRNYHEYAADTIGAALRASGGNYGGGSENLAETYGYVRRLAPLECERLQGLPDGWTLIDDASCSDTARYKAIGNGMAQPCADWIMRRVVEEHQ